MNSSTTTATVAAAAAIAAATAATVATTVAVAAAAAGNRQKRSKKSALALSLKRLRAPSFPILKPLRLAAKWVYNKDSFWCQENPRVFLRLGAKTKIRTESSRARIGLCLRGAFRICIIISISVCKCMIYTRYIRLVPISFHLKAKGQHLIFRWVHPSLYEGVSVRRLVRRMVCRMVRR